MRKKAKYSTKELVKLYYKPLKTGVKTPFLEYRDADGNRVRDYCKDINGHTYHIDPANTPEAKKHNDAVRLACMKLRADKELQIIEHGAAVRTTRATNYPLKDIAAKYCEVQHLEKNSVESYRSMLKSIGEELRIKDITAARLKKWIHEMTTAEIRYNAEGKKARGSAVTASTASQYVARLRALVSYSLRNKWITVDPFDGLDKADRDKFTAEKTQRGHLTPEEVERLEALAPEAWGDDETRRAFLLACYCGLRISDIERLRYEDIRLDNGRYYVAILQKKTGNAVYLPLSQKAAQLLNLCEDMPKNGLILPLKSRVAIARHIDNATKAAGIERKITFHLSRHTFATSLLTKDVDLYTVSKLLGHSDIKTTQIYAEIVDAKKAEAVDKL